MARTGRPVKINKEWIKNVAIPKIYEIMDTMDIKNIFLYHTKDSLASHLKISRDSLYEAIKKFPELSDTIKIWQPKANALYDAFANHPSSKLNGGIYVFTKANISNWKRQDKIEITVDKGELEQIASKFIKPDGG